MSTELIPILPEWLTAAIVVALLALLAHGCVVLFRKRVPGKWIAILAVLRVAIVAVLLLALLRPAVSYVRSRVQRPQVIVLRDVSQSMAGKTSPQLEQVVAELGERFELHPYDFDEQARPAGESQTTGEATLIGRSIESAWNHFQQAQNAAGEDARAGGVRVLLVSDGNDHGDDDPVEVARRLGIAVDVLIPQGQTDDAGAASVRIAHVQVTPRVMLGSELRLNTTLVRRDTGAQQNVALDLLEDGQQVRTLELSFEPGEAEKHVNFTHKPTAAGIKAYRLLVRDPQNPPVPPGGVASESPAPQSHPFDLSVHVVTAQNEVLLLQDTWRWDFRYLRRIFEDDPNFAFTAFLPRSATSYVQFAEPDRRVNLGGLPQSRTELAWFDMIVLGDVNPSNWPRVLPAALHELVVEEGKSLIVIAGPNISRIAQVDPIAHLLPVVLSDESARPIEGTLEVRLSPEAPRSSFFFQGVGVTDDLWRRLPTMDQVYPALRKKPGATVLVEATQHANPYGNIIVMAEHTVGRGRVLFIATDTLWKWQTLGRQTDAGTTVFSVFWQQALRSMSRNRQANAGAVIDVQPERTRYRPGQTVRLFARLSADRSLDDAQVHAALKLPESELPLTFVRDPGTPDRLVAAFDLPPTLPQTRQVNIDVTAESAGQVAAQALVALDVEQPPAERTQTLVNRSNLVRIARQTGGHVLDAEDATLPAPDDQELRRVEQARTIDLWDNMSLLIVLCGMLGVDWLLRLVRGYV